MLVFSLNQILENIEQKLQNIKCILKKIMFLVTFSIPCTGYNLFRFSLLQFNKYNGKGQGWANSYSISISLMKFGNGTTVVNKSWRLYHLVYETMEGCDDFHCFRVLIQCLLRCYSRNHSLLSPILVYSSNCFNYLFFLFDTTLCTIRNVYENNWSISV